MNYRKLEGLMIATITRLSPRMSLGEAKKIAYGIRHEMDRQSVPYATPEEIEALERADEAGEVEYARLVRKILS